MRLTLMLMLWMGLSLPALAEKYTFGITPQQTPLQSFKAWRPVIDYLAAHSGTDIVLKAEKSVEAFEKTLSEGGYDFAYMNPYQYIVAHRQQGYSAGARPNDSIRGILVSRDKHTNLVTQLRSPGIRFLFPARTSFASSLLLKYELRERYGIDLDQPGSPAQYVNSHNSVYAGIERGIGNLGGGLERTLDAYRQKSGQDSLHVIYQTFAYPSHTIAFKPTLSDRARKRLISGLTRLSPELLASLDLSPFIAAQDADYAPIRQLESKLRLSTQPKE